MDNLKGFVGFVKEVSTMKLNGTEIRIEQKQRNSLKQGCNTEMHKMLMNAFEGVEEVEVFRTAKGIALVVSNQELGGVTFTVDVMVRDLDHDAEAEALDYEEKEAEKAKKEKEKAEKLAAIALAKELAKAKHNA